MHGRYLSGPRAPVLLGSSETIKATEGVGAYPRPFANDEVSGSTIASEAVTPADDFAEPAGSSEANQAAEGGTRASEAVLAHGSSELTGSAEQAAATTSCGRPFANHGTNDAKAATRSADVSSEPAAEGWMPFGNDRARLERFARQWAKV